jgi:hypothetical protein
VDHPPHPEVCFKRLLVGAHAMATLLEERRGEPGPLPPWADPRAIEPVVRIVAEAAHLAVMDSHGFLTPYLDAMKFIYFTPEQAAQLDLALARWRQDQQKGAPP